MIKEFEGSTIPELFFQTASRFSGKTSLLYKKNNVYFPITYQDLAKKVRIFAAALLRLGVKKGDRVAILSENRPEWVVADLAIMSLGAVVVPLHTTFNPKAIQHVLGHCEAKIIIVSTAELLFKVLLSQSELNFLEKIIFLEERSYGLDQILQKEMLLWNKMIFETNGQLFDFSPKNLNTEEVCSIIYTSGTLGLPKGVELCHRNFLSNVSAVNKAVPVTSKDVFLSFLPLSHVLERLAGYYTPLFFGAAIVYAEGAKQLPRNLREVKPTILISVPRIFERFHDAVWDKINASPGPKKKLFVWALRQPKGTFRYLLADWLVFKSIRRKLGGRLRLTVSGGASLNKKLARFFSKIGILILEGYGLTETSPVVSVNREDDFNFGTVGKPVDGVEVRISSDKEILVRGPNIMKGYFKAAETTSQAIDKQGWFYTGDLGFVDQKGFLTVIGRKKEIIVTAGGENIPPEAIENELNDDRFISQSIVVGGHRKFISALVIPDWQEVKKFLKENNIAPEPPEKLIKKPEILKLFQERIDKINKRLSHYEHIGRFQLLVNEFSQEKDELTPTLKLRRHIIEKHYQKEIETIYFG